MRLLITLFAVAVLALTGCATTGLSERQAAPLAYKALGQNALLYCVEGASNPISGAMARAALPASAPIVTSLVRVVSSASQQSVRVAVAGDDSAYTAQVIKVALGSVPGDLPNLQLAFIGSRSHEAEVRRVVEGKRGKFTFEEAPPS